MNLGERERKKKRKRKRESAIGVPGTLKPSRSGGLLPPLQPAPAHTAITDSGKKKKTQDAEAGVASELYN